MSKVAYIKDPERKEFTVYTIFSRMHYGDGVLTAKFNKEMRPFLLQIKKHFTKFKLKEFKPFRSKYSIRIYQLLKQYQNFKERTFELPELRDILGVKQDELKNFSEFRVRVLKVAQRELESTPLAFDFEPIKHGRGGKVVRVKFILKNNKEENEEQPERTIEIPPSILSILPDAVKSDETALKSIAKLIKKHGQDAVLKATIYTKQHNPDDFTAYLISTVSNHYTKGKEEVINKKIKGIKAKEKKKKEKALISETASIVIPQIHTKEEYAQLAYPLATALLKAKEVEENTPEFDHLRESILQEVAVKLHTAEKLPTNEDLNQIYTQVNSDSNAGDSVPIPDFFDAVRQSFPEITKDWLAGKLLELDDAGVIYLSEANDPNELERKEFGINIKGRGFLFYIMWIGNN